MININNEIEKIKSTSKQLRMRDQAGKKLHPLSERPTFQGIMGDQLRSPPPLNPSIKQSAVMIRGVSKRPSIKPRMIQRTANLSDSYTSDCCCFASLVQEQIKFENVFTFLKESCLNVVETNVPECTQKEMKSTNSLSGISLEC